MSDWSDQRLDSYADMGPRVAELVAHVRHQRAELLRLQAIAPLDDSVAEKKLRDLQKEFDKIKRENAAYRSRYGSL